MSERRRTLGELVRYGIVGVSVNLIGYVVYLAIAALGLRPTIAMTIVYAAAVCAGFLANRRITFDHRGHVRPAAVRYLVAQLGGYLIDLALLVVFVDRLGYPHEIVQAAAVFVVASYLFVMLKVFVFRSGPVAGEATG